MKIEMPLLEARRIAEDIVSVLKPHCQKIMIAGSIRREKPVIGDIEIVALPKTYDNVDLFDTSATKTLYISEKFDQAVKSLGTIEKGKTTGRYMKIMLPEGMQLDLFLPEWYDWGRIFGIRTGSADYSQKIIANGWRKKGWVGTEFGLRRMIDCDEQKDKHGKTTKWKIINPQAEVPPPFNTEEDFFEWLGIDWVEPKYRNV